MPELTREEALQEALKWHNYALKALSKSYASPREYIHFARKDWERRDQILKDNNLTLDEWREWEHNLHQWDTD